MTQALTFPLICKAAGLPEPVTEYKFHPTRKWRADYCWPEHRVILEVEGGIWTGGRHTRGKGYASDIEKYNQATAMGYRVFRCTPQTLVTGYILDLLRSALSSSSPPRLTLERIG